MRDPRLTLARDDVAARALEGIVPAARYRDTTRMATQVPAAALRRAPSPAAEQLDQLLLGEPFEVLDEADGWAFGQAERDGYVGYVERTALGPPGAAPTHRVRALRTYRFSEPSIKAPTAGLISMNALLTAEGRDGRFIRVAGGWFVAGHLGAIDEPEPDHVAIALQFVGAPYHWGGRESLGLDCSGLVQQALYAAGRPCPRDSDQQAALGTAIGSPGRGDLVFWRGHVALMASATEIVHANAFHMAVVVEPLAEAVARISSRGGGEPTAYRRI